MAHEAPVGEELEVEQVVDAVVVTAARPLPARRSTGQVVRTQAAVVAGSFAAGAATAVVLAHRRSRAAARNGRGKRPALDVAATRSFLVDVHLLNRKP